MAELLFSLGRLAAALFLVLLNGFFVASEFAFVRVRSTSVEQMVEEGRAGAGVLQDALEHLDDYLAATQLGITVASLGLGWIGEPAVAALIEPILGEILPAGSVHLVAVALGFSAVTFLHVVFGELAPKTLAIADAEKIAIFVAPPMKVFYYAFLPGLFVFNGTANAFTSMIGVPPASETEETLSEEEIRMVLARAGEKGHVEPGEVEMIERVFDLDDITARSVMVPRPDVVTIPADAPLSSVRTLVVEHGHTRYPVMDAENGEQTVGYVDVKDVLRAGDSDANLTVGEIARDIPVVPETMDVDDLLAEFQSQQRQMAAVVDEYGGLAGIATVEDAVEVVVGEIRDGFDDETSEPTIHRRGDRDYVADGAVPIPEVNDTIGSAFEVGAYGTIGGLVLDRLGHPPEVGNTVSTGGFDIEVEAVDGARTESVVITPAAPEKDATSDV